MNYYESNQNNQLTDTISSIQIVGLNVCGMRKRLRDGIFEEFARNYDILCLSETYLQHVNMSETNLHNYYFLIKEKSLASHKFGGVHGLGMLVKNSLINHAKVINETQSPYALWVKFSKEAFGIPCIVGSV